MANTKLEKGANLQVILEPEFDEMARQIQFTFKLRSKSEAVRHALTAVACWIAKKGKNHASEAKSPASNGKAKRSPRVR